MTWPIGSAWWAISAPGRSLRDALDDPVDGESDLRLGRPPRVVADDEPMIEGVRLDAHHAIEGPRSRYHL